MNGIGDTTHTIRMEWMCFTMHKCKNLHISFRLIPVNPFLFYIFRVQCVSECQTAIWNMDTSMNVLVAKNNINPRIQFELMKGAAYP